MKDPEADDTEPTGCLDAGTEDTDPQGDAGMATEVGVPEGLEAGSSEDDTDDFLRWLPTMSLGHRRRTELVERPSSDGADFAAYACEGRPAAASVRPRPEGAVQVEAKPGSGALERGRRARSASADDRDAPTVVTRKRTGRRAVLVGVAGAVGLVAAGAAIGGWTLRPPTVAQTLLRAVASETPSAPMGDRTDRPGPGDSTPAPLAGGTQERTPSAMPSLPRTPAGPRAAAPIASARPVHKRDAVEGRAGMDAPAKVRAAPLAMASAAPLKDQYFEAP
jgi:hypothetical protein